MFVFSATGWEFSSWFFCQHPVCSLDASLHVRAVMLWFWRAVCVHASVCVCVRHADRTLTSHQTRLFIHLPSGLKSFRAANLRSRAWLAVSSAAHLDTDLMRFCWGLKTMSPDHYWNMAQTPDEAALSFSTEARRVILKHSEARWEQNYEPTLSDAIYSAALFPLSRASESSRLRTTKLYSYRLFHSRRRF